MAVETITAAAGSTIADLNADWPLGPEDLRTGDDHLRNIKKSLQLTFPALSETVQSIAQELDFAHQGGTVSGNATIKGWLSVSGTVAAQWLKTTQGLSALGNGLIATDVNASGAISASGSLVAGTTLRVNGESSFSGSVVCKQHLRVIGVLTVSGSAVVQDNLDVRGGISVSGGIVAGSIFGMRFWSGRCNISTTISHFGETRALSATYYASSGMYRLSHNINDTNYHATISNYGQGGSGIAKLAEKAFNTIDFYSETSKGSRLACDIMLFWKV